MRKTIILALLLIFACSGSALAATVVSNDASLAAAIADPSSGDIEIEMSFNVLGTKTLNRDLKIDGKGYELSATDVIFNVTSGSAVTFESVVLKNSTGKAVKVTNGNVTFSSGTSFNPSSSAVEVLDGTVDFENTSFTGLTGTDEVVKITDGTVNFKNGVKFENNSGRAVSISGGTANFPGTEFINNKGAVSISGGTVNFTDNIFRDNKGAVNGGAIELTGGSAKFNGTFVFSENSATGNGGAIYNATTNSIPVDATFTNNSAANGGAIWTDKNVTITGGTYTGNKATSGTIGDGGGAVFASGAATVTITGGTFKENNTAREGGVVRSGGGVTLRNTEFSDNSAVIGGVVYTTGLVNADNCLFSKNSAETGAGAIYCGAVSSTASSFRNNTLSGATAAGGAIYIASTSGGIGTNEIKTSLFSGQSTQGNGGAVFLQGNSSAINIHQSLFEKNLGGNGGALALQGNKAEISRSTFDSNRSNASGGALYLSTQGTIGIINSTFYENEASGGTGGAAYLTADIAGEGSAIYYSTFVNNKGTNGGALHTLAGSLYLGATAMVENTGSIAGDLLRESTAEITTLGYSAIQSYGVADGGSVTGNYNWVSDPKILGTSALKNSDIVNSSQYQNIRASIFGSNVLAVNVPAGGTQILVGSDLDSSRAQLKTIALVPSTSTSLNPAVDKIEGTTAANNVRMYFSDRTHVDARGVLRGTATPQPAGGLKADIGAFELPTGSDPGPGPDPGEDNISFVRMGGIPNTMVNIGQTCTLAAVVYTQSWEEASNQNVSWSSSNKRVAQIDDYGNLVSLGLGTTTITVTTEAYGVGGEQKSDSATLTVTGQMGYNNLHPSVLGRFADFNSSMQSKGMQVYFADLNPASVAAASFADAFSAAYGVTPRQITEISNGNDVSITSNSSYGGSYKQMKPSAHVSVSGISGYGGLLPLRYVYSMGWSEVSSLIGKNIISATEADIKALFGKVALIFVGEDGTSVTALDGENVSAALASGALGFTNGGTLTLQAEVMVGDAGPGASKSAGGRASMIDGMIVVSDNNANQKVDGEMWLVKVSGSSVGGGGSGGGGGCSGAQVPATAAFAVIVAGAALFRRR